MQTILYDRLEHPQILVSSGQEGLGPVPSRYQWTTQLFFPDPGEELRYRVLVFFFFFPIVCLGFWAHSQKDYLV